MKKHRNVLFGLFYVTTAVIILLDTKTAIIGAQNAVDLCLQTVIPSIFPFMVLSIIINSYFTGRRIKLLRPVCKICQVPDGAESIFLLGMIGGYPVGAQTITQGWLDKKIDTHTARRMLGFCNNAGPSFIFGILTCQFSSTTVVWALWLIHILSAVLVGIILPGKTSISYCGNHIIPLSPTKAIEKSTKTISIICGWIILFRILIAFLQKWFLGLLPSYSEPILFGVLELTNGLVNLRLLSSEGSRFILTSILLAIGGVCVAAQTISVTKALGTGMYFPGKLLQACFSLFLALLIQPLIIPSNQRYNIKILPIIVLLFITVFVSTTLYKKKIVAFKRNMVYNHQKRRENSYAVSQKAPPCV